MATGTGYGRTRQEDINPSYNHQTSDELNTMTLNLVKEFKNDLKNDQQKIKDLTLPSVEIRVAKIKRTQDRDKFDLNLWKKKLPPSLKNCRDTVLRVSMAYGSDPNQIIPVIEAKMYEASPNEEPTENVFDNIAEKLRTFKRELDNGPKPNVFRAVREIEDNNNDRAERLFLSEGFNFIPTLKEYTYEDAHNAVEVIRDTTGELERDSLIAILKTCRDPTEIRHSIDEAAKAKKKSSQRSEYSDDDRSTNSHYRRNNRYDEDSEDTGATSSYGSNRNNRSNGNYSDTNQQSPTSRRF